MATFSGLKHGRRHAPMHECQLEPPVKCGQKIGMLLRYTQLKVMLQSPKKIVHRQLSKKIGQVDAVVENRNHAAVLKAEDNVDISSVEIALRMANASPK